MHNAYSAQGVGSRCTICTVPEGRVPMYNMYSAQGDGPDV